MVVMTARFRSSSATGSRIAAGDQIVYDKATRQAWLVHELDPDLNPDTAIAVARRMLQSSNDYVSDHYRIGGRDYYRNRRGTCEDAPCCGCCTI
jgi:hypothetical protein